MTRCTQEQLDFLECGFKLWRRPLLTLFFNAWFGLDKTEQQITSTLKHHRFTCGRAPGNNKGYSKMYTPEQLAWIEEAYKTWSPPELAREFNKKFRANRTAQQIRTCCHQRGFLSGRNCDFKKGHKPWNNGTKGQGLTGPNSGSFKKGNIPVNVMSVGSEIVRDDGYLWRKIAEPNKWRQVHYLEWEKINGPVPAGNILWFKDQNPLNWSPDNMELLTRAELVRLNKLKFKDVPPELQPTVRTVVKIAMKRGALKSKQKEKSCHTR